MHGMEREKFLAVMSLVTSLKVGSLKERLMLLD